MKFPVIERIKIDREHGSIDLAKMVLEEALKVKDLRGFSAELKRARPDMAVFLNIAHYLSHLSEEEAREWIKENLLRIEKLPELLSQKAKEGIKQAEIITTLSISKSVLMGITALNPAKVYVLKTYPTCEGQRMADDLKRFTEPVVIDDLSMVDALKESECVIVGADCIAPAGFVNRKGTLPLAVVSSYLQIPFYVIAEELKVVNNYCEVTEELFEFVPSEFVTAYITEERVWSPFTR